MGKPNQSTYFDLERSRSGMSLLSRFARKQGIWSLWRRSDSPVFQLPLEIRGYAAVFGSIIETSLSAVLGHAIGLCCFGKIP